MVKVGDKVIIRKDLRVGFYPKSNIHVVEEMLPVAGTIQEVKDIQSNSNKFYLKNNMWHWTEELLELEELDFEEWKKTHKGGC